MINLNQGFEYQPMPILITNIVSDSKVSNNIDPIILDIVQYCRYFDDTCMILPISDTINHRLIQIQKF